MSDPTTPSSSSRKGSSRCAYGIRCRYDQDTPDEKCKKCKKPVHLISCARLVDDNSYLCNYCFPFSSACRETDKHFAAEERKKQSLRRSPRQFAPKQPKKLLPMQLKVAMGPVGRDYGYKDADEEESDVVVPDSVPPHNLGLKGDFDEEQDLNGSGTTHNSWDTY